MGSKTALLRVLLPVLLAAGCAGLSAPEADDSNLRIGAGCVNYMVCGPGYPLWNPTVAMWIYGGGGQAPPVRMEGKVGLPFRQAASARCPGGWSAAVAVTSGALPPGLRFDDQLSIVGVPERAGTWYLQVRLSSIQCEGRPVADVVQSLEIYTVGSSAPRSLQ